MPKKFRTPWLDFWQDGLRQAVCSLTQEMSNKFRLLVPALLALGCDSATGPSGPPLPLPLTDRIVFQSDRSDPKWDIYAMKFDGSDVRRLTSSPIAETCPSMSPDGNWIAYYSGVDPTIPTKPLALMLMRANGTDPREIAQIDAADGCAQWSRAGDAFEVTTFDNPSLSSSSSSEKTRVFSLDGQEIAGLSGYTYSTAAFSADGTQFLQVYRQCGNNGCTAPDLVVVNRDGTGWHWITGTGQGSFVQDGAAAPDVSLDGTTVAYICRDHVNTNPDFNSLCTVQWDGTGKVLIASNARATARYSPDGMKIAFTCGVFPIANALCVVDTDGGNLTKWPVNGDVFGVDWLPDGTGLVFDCGANKDICLMRLGAGTITNLTLGHGNNVGRSMARIP
jgi:Tol biopolymer transport system component